MGSRVAEFRDRTWCSLRAGGRGNGELVLNAQGFSLGK